MNTLSRYEKPGKVKMIRNTLLTIICLCATTGTALAESFPCLLEPSDVVELGSPVIGVLDKVLVERGDFVTADQIVAKLTGKVERKTVDLATLRANDSAEVQAAIAAKEHARREKNRAMILFQKELVSKQFVDKAMTEAELAEHKLEQARTNQKQSRMELKLARAKLNERVIRSPINGVVTERYASAGQRIQEQAILKIVSLHPLKVEVIMPAEHFNQIKIGDKVSVTPELPGFQAADATVTIVDQIIDAASNTFRVTLQLPNTQNKIPPGARCTADFNFTDKNPYPTL